MKCDREKFLTFKILFKPSNTIWTTCYVKRVTININSQAVMSYSSIQWFNYEKKTTHTHISFCIKGPLWLVVIQIKIEGRNYVAVENSFHSA